MPVWIKVIPAYRGSAGTASWTARGARFKKYLSLFGGPITSAPASMNDSAAQLAYLRDPRVSARAVAAAPAWLWSVDATRILWANAAELYGVEVPLSRA